MASQSRTGMIASLLGVATAWLSCQVHAQPVVSFGLPDYAELGLVRQAVQADYEQLDFFDRGIDANLNWTALAVRTFTQAGNLANVTNAATATATLAENITLWTDIVDADNLQQIAEALSPINYSNVHSYLNALDQGLVNLNDQTMNPIDPPTLYMYYAVAVSGRARQLAVEQRGQAVQGRASLESTLTNIGEHLTQIETLSARLLTAQQVAPQLAAAVWELSSIPGAALFIYPIVVDLTAIEANCIFLRQDTAQAEARLYAAASRAVHRAAELDDLIASIDYALTAPPLSSSWTTSANLGPGSSLFVLSFTGESFSHPYTEIDGSFPLGTLHINNLITPGAGDTLLEATIGFTVQRTVNDPLLGQVVTTATINMPMSYFASLNDENNCGQSRDFFVIPNLGVSVYICETDTRSFAFDGQYDSPLRVVSVEALPSNVDPDPAIETFAHPVHVVGGSGSGVYGAGEVVPIAAVIPEGSRFVRWDSTPDVVADPFAPATSITVPAASVLIRAVHEVIPPLYALTVGGGQGGGTFDAGAEVGVAALVPPGFRFVRWTGDVDGLLDPLASPTLAFMTRNLSIQAVLAVRDECPGDPIMDTPGPCGCEPEMDVDGDGVLDCHDVCPASDLRARVMVGGCDTGVPNAALGSGCTLNDEIAKAAAIARNHGEFVSTVTHLAQSWRSAGIITGAQHGAIVRCAGRSK